MVNQVILGNHLFIILCLPDFIQHSIYLILLLPLTFLLLLKYTIG